MLASDTRFPDPLDLAVRLFPPLGAGDGFSEAALADAERRLGVPMPARLRAYCARTGERDEMNRTRYCLIPPLYLFVRDGLLLFSTTDDGSRYAGVPVDAAGADDPPVVLLSSEGGSPR
jgi:hypothetical protein